MRGAYSFFTKVIIFFSVVNIGAPPVISVPGIGNIASEDGASFLSPSGATP